MQFARGKPHGRRKCERRSGSAEPVTVLRRRARNSERAANSMRGRRRGGNARCPSSAAEDSEGQGGHHTPHVAFFESCRLRWPVHIARVSRRRASRPSRVQRDARRVFHSPSEAPRPLPVVACQERTAVKRRSWRTAPNQGIPGISAATPLPGRPPHAYRPVGLCRRPQISRCKSNMIPVLRCAGRSTVRAAAGGDAADGVH